MLSRTVSVLALIVLFAAGCGGGSGGPRQQPRAAKLPHALAQRWAGEADAIASAVQAHDGCGAKQLARTLAADVDANRGRIPARLRTDLTAAVTTLVDRISCVQPKPKPKPKPKGPKPPPDKGPKKDHGPHHGHGDGG